MKILIFNWRDLKHSWAGGGEIYIFELAKRWVKMGHEVTVFCSQDPYQTLPEEEIYDGIKVIRKGSRFSVYPFALINYLKNLRGKFDVLVDVENGIPFFTPIFSRIPKASFVYHVHKNQFFYELKPPISNVGFMTEKFLFPFLYRNTKIVAISETTKKDLINLGFKQRNIEIVYCGVNQAPEQKSIKKFSIPTLLYLGRIKSYKRVDLLFDIFKDVLKEVPDARLIIAGWGTEGAGLADRVLRSELRRKIDILGPVTESEKKNLLSKSWVFVNPSIGEGWSIAVIEANLYGTPAAAFNVPGLSESIKDKVTGILAKDREDLTKKIIKLLKNKNYREKLSENAKNYAKTFSWDNAAKESIRILEKLNG